MTIRLLAPDLVSKIAAGEVIERPASVVKELVENSLDAGASQISVEVHNGGLNMVRVSDNGTGIPASEVELAFTRHATSKLSSLADLETIRSLGFRGEALPSIAAVADVEIWTAVPGASGGKRVRLSGGAAVESTPDARPPGTTVTVQHLFNTTPARLKFLKSTRAEGTRIAYLMGQFALAFPEVRFTLSFDGRTSLQTGGSGRLRDALTDVYGAGVSAAMLEVSDDAARRGSAGDSPLPRVSGFAGPPQLSRSTRTYVSFFVNRRWVTDRALSRAVDEAYQGLLMVGRQPIVVVNVDISPAEVDVNVHPTKREVRFRHEALVFSTVNRAIKRALSTALLPQIGIAGPGSPAPAAPFAWQEAASRQGPALRPVMPGAAQQDPGAATLPQPHSWPDDWGGPEQPAADMLHVLGQIDSTYIVAEASAGLYLVDQHAAHERILFERFTAQRSEQRIETQGLLDPPVLELSPEEDEAMAIRGGALKEFGFAVEQFGERSYLVRAVPAMLARADIGAVLRELLASGGKVADQEWFGKATASLACHGAIRAGQRLDSREAAELLRQLEGTSSPRTCPHGRPTMVHLSSSELRRHFGRE